MTGGQHYRGDPEVFRAIRIPTAARSAFADRPESPSEISSSPSERFKSSRQYSPEWSSISEGSKAIERYYTALGDRVWETDTPTKNRDEAVIGAAEAAGFSRAPVEEAIKDPTT